LIDPSQKVIEILGTFQAPKNKSYIFLHDHVKSCKCICFTLMSESMLEWPPKIVVTKFFFAFCKIDKMCTPNMMIAILWVLGRFEKFRTCLNQFFKKINKNENVVCDEYIWTKIIPITKYENDKYKSKARLYFMKI
jgi:hypothetical protein